MFHTNILTVLLFVTVCVKTREQVLFEPALINMSVGRVDISSPNTAWPSHTASHVSTLFALSQIRQLNKKEPKYFIL